MLRAAGAGRRRPRSRRRRRADRRHPRSEAFALLDDALERRRPVVAGARYRFRHELVRQALVEQLPPHERLAIHRETPQRLADADAPPGPDRAALARRRAPGRGRRLAAGRGPAGGRARRLRRRARRTSTRCSSTSPSTARRCGCGPRRWTRSATPVRPRPTRGRGASSAARRRTSCRRSRRSPRSSSATRRAPWRLLEGVEPTTLDGRLAQALAHCAARRRSGTAIPRSARRRRPRPAGWRSSRATPTRWSIASWAQAAAAHARGELRESVRADLRETQALPKLAVSVFDGQLCITQRLLYGARPYADVIAFADSLAAEAERLGAARGRAFAVTIRGEAKLLSGELDDAGRGPAPGRELHREIGAATGEAFALQRRAEVALQRGDRVRGARRCSTRRSRSRASPTSASTCSTGSTGRGSRAAPDPDGGPGRARGGRGRRAGPDRDLSRLPDHARRPGRDRRRPRRRRRARASDGSATSEYLANVVMRLPAWDAALDEVRGHRAQAERRSGRRGRALQRRRATASRPRASRSTRRAAPSWRRAAPSTARRLSDAASGS